MTYKLLGKNAAATLLGSLLNSVSQWLIVVTISRFDGATTLGDYALAVAIAQPVFTLFGLQLRDLQMTDANHQFTFHDYAIARLVTLFISCATTLLISHTAAIGSAAIILPWIAGCLAIDSLSEVIHGHLMQKEDMVRPAYSISLRSLFSTVAFSLTFVTTLDLISSIGAQLLARALALTISDGKLAYYLLCTKATRRETDYRATVSNFIKLFRVAMPFSVSSAILAIRSSLPRFVIASTLGQSELGAFAAISTMVSPLQMIGQSVYQSTFPRMARTYVGGAIVDLKLLLARITIVTSVLVVGFSLFWIAFGRSILEEVFLIQHRDASIVLGLLTITTGFQLAAKPSGVISRISRRFSSQIAVHLVAIPLMLITMSFLSQHYGLIGASLSLCAVTAITTITVTVISLSQINTISVSLNSSKSSGLTTSAQEETHVDCRHAA